MKCKVFCFVFLLVALMTSVAFSQKKTEDKVPITPAEQREVQAFAKRFVKRLHQTRDLTSLISEFFVSDFTSCLKKETMDSEDVKEKKIELSSNEILRSYIASMNLVYLSTVSFTYQGDKKDSDSVKSGFPPHIQRQMDALEQEGNSYDEHQPLDRKTYLKALRQSEKLVLELRYFIIREKIDTAPAFRKEFNRYANSDWLGYVVKAEITNQNEYCTSSGIKRYTVTTPTWLVLSVTREKGRLKVAYIFMYDD